VLIRYSSLAALLALGAAPALATTAAPTTAPTAAARPAAGNSAQPIPRAAVIKSRDDAFKKIDTNGDGSLSAAELAASDAAVLRARLQAEFTQTDTNKDGQLSQAEYLARAPLASALMPNAQKAVANFDKNKDGKITADEFRGPQLAAFDKLDTNHDGSLSVAERQAAAPKR
jgi:hypothetical protein